MMAVGKRWSNLLGAFLVAGSLMLSQALVAQSKPAPAAQKPETHITPAQAKELFRSVDQILRFASGDTGLPIKHKVKRRLTTRAAVEKYLDEKMKDDKDARRMERSEIVLKKFGLISPDFQLEPFLVSLLKEQIAGYYDSKTKTVNLLDWIDPEMQKPVLAHELTHALQDQHVDLNHWEDQSEEGLSRNFAQDKRHIATDEDDTAREAVLEGQAMAVFVDYGLKPSGHTLLNTPQIIDGLTDRMTTDSSSPVLSRAPLLIQESLLFPYREGLKFEAAVLTDEGKQAAFAGVLDHPPSSSYQIMNPRAYERHKPVPVLRMPDIHPVLDAKYNPYDIGVMGQFDVRVLAQLFGGDKAAALLTPAWDGGIYYAAQKKSAKTAAEKGSTASIGLFYLSRWKSRRAAAAFVRMYVDELGKKFSNMSPDTDAEVSYGEQIFKTGEGPVLIAVSGDTVFVSETFDLDTARKLEFMMMNAQQGSGGEIAKTGPPVPDLTGSLVHFMAACGVMKAAMKY